LTRKGEKGAIDKVIAYYSESKEEYMAYLVLKGLQNDDLEKFKENAKHKSQLT